MATTAARLYWGRHRCSWGGKWALPIMRKHLHEKKNGFFIVKVKIFYNPKWNSIATGTVFAASDSTGLLNLVRFVDEVADYFSKQFGRATCFHLQGAGGHIW
jgi:hypothetical protein